MGAASIIQGVVKDIYGRTLAGAIVSIPVVPPQTSFDDGSYALAVPAGTYTLSVSYQTMNVSASVTVGVGQTLVKDMAITNSGSYNMSPGQTVIAGGNDVQYNGCVGSTETVNIVGLPTGIVTDNVINRANLPQQLSKYKFTSTNNTLSVYLTGSTEYPPNLTMNLADTEAQQIGFLGGHLNIVQGPGDEVHLLGANSGDVLVNQNGTPTSVSLTVIPG